MKLYLVHCGFYDQALCEGLYESHVNFFVAAETFEGARARVRLIPEFRAKKMHVDGLQEISAVEGHRIRLEHAAELGGATEVMSSRQRDLAPRPAETPQTDPSSVATGL